jgi:hypothetical protein
MSSPHSLTSIDLRFATPQWRFTFSEYLQLICNFDPWEYEDLEYYYQQYQHIYFS